jgi:hypothetical protein
LSKADTDDHSSWIGVELCYVAPCSLAFPHEFSAGLRVGATFSVLFAELRVQGRINARPIQRVSSDGTMPQRVLEERRMRFNPIFLQPRQN